MLFDDVVEPFPCDFRELIHAIHVPLLSRPIRRLIQGSTQCQRCLTTTCLNHSLWFTGNLHFPSISLIQTIITLHWSTQSTNPATYQSLNPSIRWEPFPCDFRRLINAIHFPLLSRPIRRLIQGSTQCPTMLDDNVFEPFPVIYRQFTPDYGSIYWSIQYPLSMDLLIYPLKPFPVTSGRWYLLSIFVYSVDRSGDLSDNLSIDLWTHWLRTFPCDLQAVYSDFLPIHGSIY
jgi:hypothetical protein